MDEMLNKALGSLVVALLVGATGPSFAFHNHAMGGSHFGMGASPTVASPAMPSSAVPHSAMRGLQSGGFMGGHHHHHGFDDDFFFFADPFFFSDAFFFSDPFFYSYPYPYPYSYDTRYVPGPPLDRDRSIPSVILVGKIEVALQATIVRSVPLRRTAASPIGTRWSPSGISPRWL